MTAGRPIQTDLELLPSMRNEGRLTLGYYSQLRSEGGLTLGYYSQLGGEEGLLGG